MDTAEGDREMRLAALLRAEAAATLGFNSPEEVSLDRPFSALGMDSLMMAEFIGRLARRVGVSCTSLVFEHPEIRELAPRLLELLVPALATEAGAPPDPNRPAAGQPVDAGESTRRRGGDQGVFNRRRGRGIRLSGGGLASSASESDRAAVALDVRPVRPAPGGPSLASGWRAMKAASSVTWGRFRSRSSSEPRNARQPGSWTRWCSKSHRDRAVGYPAHGAGARGHAVCVVAGPDGRDAGHPAPPRMDAGGAAADGAAAAPAGKRPEGEAAELPSPGPRGWG